MNIHPPPPINALAMALSEGPPLSNKWPWHTQDEYHCISDTNHDSSVLVFTSFKDTISS